MEQWEYRSHHVTKWASIVDGQKKDLDPWLNELGRQGWELVGGTTVLPTTAPPICTGCSSSGGYPRRMREVEGDCGPAK